MIRILRNNNPLMLILIPVISGLLLIKAINFNSELPLISGQSILYESIFSYFSESFKNMYIYYITSVILISIQAFLIIRINNKFNLTNENNFFPAFIFLLLSVTIIKDFSSLPISIGTIFLLLSIDGLFYSESSESTVFNYLNSGLLFALASLFYSGIGFFFVLVLSNIFLYKNNKFKKFIASLIGFFIPYFIIFSVQFIFFNQFPKNIFEQIFAYKSDFGINLNIAIYYLVILIMSLFSIVYLLFKFSARKIFVRKSYYFLFLLLIISVPIYLFSKSVGNEIIILQSISFCFIISIFLESPRLKIFKEVLFAVFLISVILFQVMSDLKLDLIF